MKRIAILFLPILLMGAGCTWMQPADDSGDRIMAPEAFTLGSWALVSYTPNGEPEQDVSDVGATLTLEANGQLSAKICNSMSVDYSIEDGELEAPQLVSTLMFCTGVPGEVEVAFTQDLATGFDVQGGDDELVLVGDTGAEFVFERSEGDEMSGDEEAMEEESASGTVVSVNLDGIAFDGPAIVTVETDAGAEVEIHVPSFGLGLCAAKESITDVYVLKAGQHVEVRGNVSEDGVIVPCESSDHYLRVQE